MNFELKRIETKDLPRFKQDMQEAFQMGAVNELSEVDVEILPEADINASLRKPNAFVYKAVVNGEMLGGAIVVIDEITKVNHLDFLYVKYGAQGRKIGQHIWQRIEELYPDTKIWKTCTPYFDKRNIHFYINCCGFHAVEFINPHHKSTSTQDDKIFEDDFFMFQKTMK